MLKHVFYHLMHPFYMFWEEKRLGGREWWQYLFPRKNIEARADLNGLQNVEGKSCKT